MTPAKRQKKFRGPAGDETKEAQKCAGPFCRNTVEQPATGRPRRFCSTPCRQAEYRWRQNARCPESITFYTSAGQCVVPCDLTVGEHRRQPNRVCEARVVVHGHSQGKLVS